MGFWDGASLFGSGGDSGSYNPTTTSDAQDVKDQRVVAEIDDGTLVSPDGQLASGQGKNVTVEPWGEFNETYEAPVTMGIDGASVNSLVDKILGAEQLDDEHAQSNLQSAIAATQSSNKTLTDIIEAIKSPEGTDWKKFLPYAILGIFALYIWKGTK